MIYTIEIPNTPAKIEANAEDFFSFIEISGWIDAMEQGLMNYKEVRLISYPYGMPINVVWKIVISMYDGKD